MSLKAAIQEWNERKQAELIQSYEREGLKASGRWARELEGQTFERGNSYVTIIEGANYTEQLVKGRGKSMKKGSGRSLRELIREWIDDKGIVPSGGISKESLSFLIARKIHRDGIIVPNKYNSGKFIDRVMNEKAISELKQIVQRSFGEVVKSEIMKGL